MRRFLIAGVAAAQCISGLPAHADSNSESPLRVDVRYADLDLAHLEGATALYTRLRGAARRYVRRLSRGSLNARSASMRALQTPWLAPSPRSIGRF